MCDPTRVGRDEDRSGPFTTGQWLVCTTTSVSGWIRGGRVTRILTTRGPKKFKMGKSDTGRETWTLTTETSLGPTSTVSEVFGGLTRGTEVGGKETRVECGDGVTG